MRTYKITTTHLSSGQVRHVDYQPKRPDEDVPGRVTSMRQYRSYLQANLNAGKLQLYTINSKGRSLTLDDDEDLLSAVRALPPRGVLAICAIGEEMNPPVVTALGESFPGEFQNMHRNVPKVLPEVMTKKSELRKILDRFCRYTDVECYYCPKTTWSGARYKFHINDNFILCFQCYDKLDQDQGRLWILSGRNWELMFPNLS